MGCSVSGCKGHSERKVDGITFHSFPSNVKIQKKWLHATGRKNWKPSKYSRICSIHFDDDLFDKKEKRVQLKPLSVTKKQLSESEYKKRSAAALDSEDKRSSDEEPSPPKKVKKCSTATKSKKEVSCKKPSKRSSIAVDLFGEEPVESTSSKTAPLWTSLSRRVADGVLRQAELLEEGDIFFDLKVYNTPDIINIDLLQRSDKWSAQLRVRVEPEDPLWGQIKKLCSDTKKRFSKEATFYANKKIK